MSIPTMDGKLMLDIIHKIARGRAYSQAALSWRILGVALWRTCGDVRAVRAGAPTHNIPALTQSLDAVTGATCRSTQRLPVQRQLSPLCQLRPEAIMFVTGS